MPSTAITTFTNIFNFPTVELIQNTPPTLCFTKCTLAIFQVVNGYLNNIYNSTIFTFGSI